MWFAVGLLIICFTIIVLFRMYIDLTRQSQQHSRMVQSDQRSFQRYQEVRQLPPARPAMVDFQEAIDRSRREMEHRIHMERMKALPRTRYWAENEPPRPSLEELREAKRMVRYKKAKLDPRLLTTDQAKQLANEEYQRWLMEQRRKYG